MASSGVLLLQLGPCPCKARLAGLVQKIGAFTHATAEGKGLFPDHPRNPSHPAPESCLANNRQLFRTLNPALAERSKCLQQLKQIKGKGGSQSPQFPSALTKRGIKLT